MSDAVFDPRIDKHALDEECVNQPVLYHTYAVKHADAKRAVDEAKQDLDVCRAETEVKIRRAPGDYGLEKVTDASVAAALAADDSIIRLTGVLIEARHDADVMGAALGALDHRKRMLELIVKLRGLDYFAEPRIDDAASRKGVEEISNQRFAAAGVAPDDFAADNDDDWGT